MIIDQHIGTFLRQNIAHVYRYKGINWEFYFPSLNLFKLEVLCRLYLLHSVFYIN